jgi:hypothetical protein
MTYRLIEHRLGDGGSVTEGKGYGVVPLPLQIIFRDTEIPPAYRDISTVTYWHKFGRDLGYDYLFIRDRIIEAAIAALPKMDVYSDPAEIEEVTENLVVIVGENPDGIFARSRQGQYATYSSDKGWQLYDPIDYVYHLAL